MSRLDELLQELCPDGVEYGKIGDLVDYEQPSKYIVSSTNYNDDYDVPVLTAGQSFILGYTDETDGICEASKDNPVIIFDDFTGAFKWVDFPFKVKSSAMKILRPKLDVAIFRYVFHLMGWLNYTSSEHKRLWIGIYSEFEVPVPPLEVQREIVRILDKFTQLRAELSAELSARRVQYEHYRNELLTFGDDVPLKSIGEICSVSAGGDAPKDAMSKKKEVGFEIPIVSNGIGDNALYGYTNMAKITEPAVTVAARGTIGYAEYRDYPYYPIIRLLTVMPKNNKEVHTKYLYYCLAGKEYSIPQGGIPQLTAPMLKKELIPIPSIDKQKEIIRILDRFNCLTTDIYSGIPAEIEARTKQYEFYRDKLLSFKRKEAS